MNKQKSLKWINIFLIIDFILLTTSAVMKDAISEHTYEQFHPLLGFILFILVVAHVILNWTWVKNNLFK